MKFRIASMMTAGLLLALAPEALPHGGQYRGPGDTVPPTEGPGPNTGGPTTGGPNTGGPITGGGPRGPITPGNGPVPGGGGPPRGAGAMTGGRPRPTEDTGSWHFWWEVNKDQYLDLRHKLAGGNGPDTGSTGFIDGAGRSVRGLATNRPTEEALLMQVVPVLREALKETDADIVDSAALALGRMLDARKSDEATASLREVLKSPYDSARQAAILALGLMERRDAIPDLIEIMKDSEQGRKLTRGGAIDNVSRGFAAIALGYIGDASTVPVLIETARSTPDTARDVRSSAIQALGMFNDEKAAIVVALTELLRDDSMLDDVRGTIPIALWRLGDVAVPAIPQLVRIVGDDRAPLVVAQSSIIALGHLSTANDKDVITALRRVTEKCHDAHARHFAIMALGELAAKTAEASEFDAPQVGELAKILIRQFTKPEYSVDRPWGALALGVFARSLKDTSPIRGDISGRLGEAFQREQDPVKRAVCAISLGLMGSYTDGEMLLKVLIKNEPNFLRGYLAIALGMMKYLPATDFLRTQVVVEIDDATRLNFATALGLMGDARAVPDLIKGLKSASTLAQTMSFSKALGLVGDSSALPALLALAADKKETGLARGFACVALGMLGEKTVMYWNTRLSAGANYRLSLKAQSEILDIL